MAELLADHTSFRIGGPAASWVEADSEELLVDAVRQADASGTEVLILSGGSNVLVSDDGFPGTVVHVATRGIASVASACEVPRGGTEPSGVSCGGRLVTVAAGEPWDEFVEWCVGQDLQGVECLSGIPGAVGSTPIQNVGAYGQDVSQTIWSVRTWDRVARTQRTFANADCGFGYRTSRFKSEPGRYVVLEVTFQFTPGDLSLPIRFGELATRLGLPGGGRAPMVQVREQVLALRRGKGMVADADDHDTWSAGSFFTNPVLTSAASLMLPEDAPRYPQPDGSVKSSAAWLIERAGFPRGFALDEHPFVAVSSKHTLALINRGGARASDVVALALAVQDGVRAQFGVTLVAEPVLVGVSLG